MRLGTIVCVLVSVFAFALVAQGGTIHVPATHPTIQEAINAASSGDTIIVGPGVYPENIAVDGKQLHLISERGPVLTVIEGNGSASGGVVYFVNCNGSSLEGFTIRNGQQGLSVCGDMTVRHNYITGNKITGGGAGIWIWDSSPLIEKNVVYNNESFSYDGGGISIVSGSIGSSPVVRGNLIFGNKAGKFGGGMRIGLGAATVVGNTIVGNEARYGGGVYFDGDTAAELYDNIVWDNTSTYGHQEIYIASGTPVIEFCDIKGGTGEIWFGTGCIDLDPLFVDQSINDLHLQWNSPCRDTGTASAPGLPDTDFEGDPRIALSNVDIGADEFYFHLYHTTDSGFPGLAVSPGGTVDIRVVGIPTWPVELLLSSGLQDPPMSTYFGDLFLQVPFDWEGAIGKIGPTGVRIFSATVPLTWLPGDSKYLQALVGWWYMTETTLTNLLTLHVEV